MDINAKTLDRRTAVADAPCEKAGKYRHAAWALIVPLSLMLFGLTEELVATDGYHAMYSPLDDKIPFLPAFIIPYSLWYPVLFAVGIHHLLKDADAFRRYMWSFGLCYAISMTACIIFPNGQDLRPVLDNPDTLFTKCISLLHKIDTNTNVFPSIHTSASMLIMFAALDSKRTRKWFVLLPLGALCTLIIMSTVFIKQHSILDVFGGLGVAAVLYIIVYVVIKKIQNKRRLTRGFRTS